MRSSKDVNEQRDVGPFLNADQVLEQFTNWSHGMPISMDQAAKMVLEEGVLLAGILPSDFERSYLEEHGLDPFMATIISGWLIRAAYRRAAPPVNPDVRPDGV